MLQNTSQSYLAHEGIVDSMYGQANTFPVVQAEADAALHLGHDAQHAAAVDVAGPRHLLGGGGVAFAATADAVTATGKV